MRYAVTTHVMDGRLWTHRLLALAERAARSASADPRTRAASNPNGSGSSARVTRGRSVAILLTLLFLSLVSTPAFSQVASGMVVDQTGLPLPGVTLRVFDDGVLVVELTSAPDGTFAIPATGAFVVASLDGFEETRVTLADATRIVLQLAGTMESTTVTATAESSASPAALSGGRLTAATVARLPSSHMHAKESLPLLPSVIRGADGLMQLGGARAYQTPLTLDGFNVTDPATGLSSLNLPLESVLSVDALRDPMAITYGDLLGGMVRMESRGGAQMPAFGVQGFVPRPRFDSPGFGRLEGIFPRAHIAGTLHGSGVQYAVAGEYDYERIPVPHVTDTTGRDLIEESGILFARLDAPLNPRTTLTLEGFSFPADTRYFGLGPRRSRDATVTLASSDLFAGAVLRHISTNGSLLTFRVGAYGRDSASRPNGIGPAVLSSTGWSGNWFSTWSRTSSRLSSTLSWERTISLGGRAHEWSASVDVSALRMRGNITNSETRVFSSSGGLVRRVTFDGTAPLSAHDTTAALAVRDVWHFNGRLQIDGGLRVDTATLTPAVASARVGLRFNVDEAGRTVVKAGAGRFVGVVPLVAASFAGYPSRTDAWFDETSGESVKTLTFSTVASPLQRPRARTLMVDLEHELLPGLDLQFVETHRQSSALPTIDVPASGGPLTVRSSGTSAYTETQISGRRVFTHDQQLFVSYVRSTAVGELNEVATQTMEMPLLEPGGRARTSNDARHRVLTWGTVDLPARVVISPAIEWHSGFTYSQRSSRYTYVGTPNSRTFPAFFSLDLVTYKTVTVHGYTADVGVQVFNATNHWNPRDVFPVVGEPDFGHFANSVGRIVRGYMLVKW